ncbi:MAG TPA: type I methionyl aminopeptidase [Candidatus Saccharimonadales bacterium]|nr:type I methionyl aminopeptidase [Candidatus Saccharimonadales bacterium]
MSSIRIKTEPEIAAMRESGRMLATVLELLRKRVKPGLTPKDMSAMARTELKKLGGAPAFLGFYGYPDIICISVNEQVQHSIPTNVPFKAGDVVNFDFGVRYKGMTTDAGISVCVGNKFTPETRRLLEGTELALYDGIAQVRAGGRVGDISAAIEATLRKYHLGIVRELVGHGVGHELHEDPEIPNYGHAGTGPVLKAGMTIAIEPITTLGDHAIVELHDGWTLVTRDRSWSAQFEHTVLITDTGAEILTTT